MPRWFEHATLRNADGTPLLCEVYVVAGHRVSCRTHPVGQPRGWLTWNVSDMASVVARFVRAPRRRTHPLAA